MFKNYKLKIRNCNLSNLYYQIYPLGFFNCPEINPIAQINPPPEQIQPFPRLAEIRKFYPYFQELKIDVIYFGPIFESCTHGYDTIDYFQIDRRLGTNELFKEIVGELHQIGIKVILDGVFHHVSRLFPAFIDLRHQHQQSVYADWFCDLDFSSDTIWNDGFSYGHWDEHVELPRLNLTNPKVQHFIYQIATHWLREYHIDGWRLDLAYRILPTFWQNFSQICRYVNPDCLLIGELIHENYNQWVQPNIFNSCTNYQLSDNIWQSFNQHNFWMLKDELVRQQHIYPDLSLLNFVSNHDINRLSSKVNDLHHLPAIFTLLFTLPGQPCLYYGDEIALPGQKIGLSDQAIRQSFLNLPTLTPFQQSLSEFIKQLSQIRHQTNFLIPQQIKILIANHHIFCFQTHSQPQLTIAINSSTHSQKIDLSSHFSQSTCFDLINHKHHQTNQIILEPYQPLILTKI